MPRTTTTPATAPGDLPDEWRHCWNAVATARTALISGLPGTGKSMIANDLTDHPSGEALDVANDVWNLTLHDDAMVGDVLGTYLPKLGKWDWRDGPCAQAWRTSWERPVRVVLNEVDQASGAVLTALYAVMDSPGSAKLTLPTGETIRPHPERFQVVSTMNGTVEDLPLALADRHQAKVLVNSPHPDSVLALPTIWQDTAKGLCAASARLAGRGTSPREWHALAHLTGKGLGLADATALVWPPERAKEVHDHLLIAGADPAPRIRPKAAKVTPKVTAAAPSGGPEFVCPDGHGFNSGPDSEGTMYPDAEGAVWCDECGGFYKADDCAERAAR